MNARNAVKVTVESNENNVAVIVARFLGKDGCWTFAGHGESEADALRVALTGLAISLEIYCDTVEERLAKAWTFAGFGKAVCK